ncbi:hypothetical protein N9063_00415 [Deltaproteobacteria bacterium]|nr:hypothetical protein [Deltaproteobacteria bacterium]
MIRSCFALKIFGFFQYYWDAFRLRIRQYLVVLKWFLLDSLGPVKFTAAGIVVIGFLGVTFQIGALGLVVAYANTLARGGEVSLLEYSFYPRESLALLMIFSLGFLALSVLSAWMIYLSNKWIFNLALDYEQTSIRRVYRTISQFQNIKPTPVIKAELPEQSIMKLVGGDSRIVTRILRVILSAVVPLITFVFATAVLFASNLTLSLLLSLVVLLSAFFYFKVNLESLGDAKKMETTGKPLSILKRTLIRRFSGTSVQMGSQTEKVADSLLSDELCLDNMLGFRGRIMASDKSRLVSDHLMAVCIVLIFLVIGYQMLSSHSDWNRLVVYLLALRYCLANFQKVTGTITTVNRFYSVIKRLYDFAMQADRRSVELAEFTGLDNITCLAKAESKTEAGYLPALGDIVRVLAPLPLTRFTLPEIFSVLCNKPAADLTHIINSTWFFTRKATLPPLPIKQYLGVPNGGSVSDFILSHLPEEKGRQVIGQLPLDNSGCVSDAVWSKASGETRCIVGVLAAINSGKPIVVIDEDAIRFLEAETLAQLLDKFDNSYVFVYGETFARMDLFSWSKVVLLGNRSVEGIGSLLWAQENKRFIEVSLRISRQDAGGSVLADDDDDDVDLL